MVVTGGRDSLTYVICSYHIRQVLMFLSGVIRCSSSTGEGEGEREGEEEGG